MVKFEWHYREATPQTIKEFLKQQRIPRKFVSYIKFDGGSIRLNQVEVNVLAVMQAGDHLEVVAPAEVAHETVPPSYVPIEVVYEDRDLLVVNKPNDVVSIPSRRVPDSAMANRIKGYYITQGYADQVVHIVTRLDRQTTGLMMIAKHRLAHALMDQQIQSKQLKKYYQAISTRSDWPAHGEIDGPIARCDQSIITRQVAAHGQAALTEYWVEERYKDSALLRLQLHTGRTHQIRVHLESEGGVLVGDDLYGGPHRESLTRQALHCAELTFYQPFTKEAIRLVQPLPEDMQAWITKRRKEM